MLKSSYFGVAHSRRNSKKEGITHLRTEANHREPPMLHSLVIPETQSNSKYQALKNGNYENLMSNANPPSLKSIENQSQ